MNSLIESLKEKQSSYIPSESVSDHLRHVVMAPIIGPVAVGKSTCMDKVVALNPDEFGRVNSFTTRPVRPGEAETEYRFLTHDAATLQAIFKMAQNGGLVQFAVHPTTGFIYGSDTTDYPKPYMMLDTLSGSVEALRQLPFKSVCEIALIMNPDTWTRCFTARPMEHDERNKRLTEGVASLEWSLDQGNTIAWVINRSRRIRSTAETIAGLMTGTIEPSQNERKTGIKLLNTIRELL